MRISDWSSDVCSSDLYRSIRLDRLVAEANRYAVLPIMIDDPATAAFEVSGRFHVSQTERFADRIASLFGLSVVPERSEEHTSELQSLMRISYAVFCLKKKKRKYKHNRSTESKTRITH